MGCAGSTAVKEVEPPVSPMPKSAKTISPAKPKKSGEFPTTLPSESTAAEAAAPSPAPAEEHSERKRVSFSEEPHPERRSSQASSEDVILEEDETSSDGAPSARPSELGRASTMPTANMRLSVEVLDTFSPAPPGPASARERLTRGKTMAASDLMAARRSEPISSSVRDEETVPMGKNVLVRGVLARGDSRSRLARTRSSKGTEATDGGARQPMSQHTTRRIQQPLLLRCCAAAVAAAELLRQPLLLLRCEGAEVWRC